MSCGTVTDWSEWSNKNLRSWPRGVGGVALRQGPCQLWVALVQQLLWITYVLVMFFCSDINFAKVKTQTVPVERHGKRLNEAFPITWWYQMRAGTKETHLHDLRPSSLSSLPLAICVKFSPPQLFCSDAEMTPEGNTILLVARAF